MPPKPPIGRGGAGVMLALAVLFILYGSFFPFTPRPGAGGDALGHLLATWRNWDRRGDLIANILFYMPLGLFLAMLLPRAGWAAAALAGAGLSFMVELGQHYVAGRDSTMGDVYANTIGALLGGLVALAGPPRLIGAVAPVPALLIAAWLGDRLYPFVPVIDLHKYLAALRGLQRPLVPMELGQLTLDWLIVAWLAGLACATPRRLLLLALALAWGGQLLLIDRLLSPADIVGGGIALLVLLARRRGLPALPLALLLAASMLAAVLLPPAPPLRDFASPLLAGSPGLAVRAFCGKLFAIGSLILLADAAGAGLRRATLGVAAWLLGLAMLRLWLPGHGGDVADAPMALLTGLAFHVTSRTAPAARGRKS